MSHGQSYIYKELHGSPESMDTRTPFCGVHYAGTLTKQIPNKTLYIIYMEQSCDAATWNNFAPVFSSPPPPPPLGSHRSNHLHPPTSLPSWGGGRFKSQNVQFHSLTLKKRAPTFPTTAVTFCSTENTQISPLRWSSAVAS